MHRRALRGLTPRSLVYFQLLFIVFTVFMLGALYFAYQIYETARQAAIIMGEPEIGDLPALIRGPQVQATPVPPKVSAGERVNVLLLGIDRRVGEKCPCRTDTIMLASLDPQALTASLITIPRDLYVEIPGMGNKRINTATAYGELYKLPGGGPALAKKTVENTLGRTVHYYVLVDFGGFRKAIDALGGIDITVPRAIDDPTYPDDRYGYKPLHIPAGKVHMNGETALAYARTRHVDNDFGRMKRQVQVLQAVRDRALRPENLARIPQLAQALWGSFETDVPWQDALSLAQIASKVKTENITTATVDETMVMDYTTSAGEMVLWPQKDKITSLVNRLIPQQSASAPAVTTQVQKEGASVLVLNGTGNSALAEQAAKYLQSRGFRVAGYGNADRLDYGKTVLIDFSGSKTASVGMLAQLFRIEPENLRSTRSKSDTDIRLIVGADWTPPPVQ